MAGRRSSRGWWIVAAILVVLVAIAAIGVIAITGSEFDRQRGHAGTGKRSGGGSVHRLGANRSRGRIPRQRSGNRHRVTQIATRRSEDARPRCDRYRAGLYGGSGDSHVCDPQQLIAFLQQHPDKASAWASILGISPSGIANYVNSLTPVVLTVDTLVTNHGFRNGRATTLQSVLQAGTAVMVDATGTPRVKCNCGNPLTPPQLITPSHTTRNTVAGLRTATGRGCALGLTHRQHHAGQHHQWRAV